METTPDQEERRMNTASKIYYLICSYYIMFARTHLFTVWWVVAVVSYTYDAVSDLMHN